ncbi:MAG: sulfurtransferase [Burkholderiales bacterium RIFCSPLOWO2_02_FULL_57_36]|nr:MAG: sulfurtransferase [Burkholderiales bacterium RIFCSPLOWO2_02_FULL_57_36]
MTAERIVHIVAGFFILLSLSLGVEGSPLFVSKYFLWFTAFVGLNLFQSGFTNFCPLTSILGKFGIKGGSCER